MDALAAGGALGNSRDSSFLFRLVRLHRLEPGLRRRRVRILDFDPTFRWPVWTTASLNHHEGRPEVTASCFVLTSLQIVISKIRSLHMIVVLLRQLALRGQLSWPSARPIRKDDLDHDRPDQGVAPVQVRRSAGVERSHRTGAQRRRLCGMRW